MVHRRDLPLSKDSTTQLVPWIVGVMAYLTALALAAALALSNVANKWSDGLEGALTVQVPATEEANTDETDTRIVAVVRILLDTPGIDSARPVPLTEIGKLLEPWLGSAVATADLPLPRSIDVRLESGASVDFAALSIRLAQEVPQDTYIAEQFQKHAFRLALKGSIGGTACALATLLGIASLTGDVEASLLPPTMLAYWHWPVLAALPVGEAYGAMFTARITILRALKRMG